MAGRRLSIPYDLVNIKHIKSTQDYLFEDVVKLAMLALRDGWDVDVVPPITAYHYTDGIYIHDGHHRLEAARRLGITEIPVINRARLTTGQRSYLTRILRRYRSTIEHPYQRARQ